MRPASDSLRRARPLLGTFVEIVVTSASQPAVNTAIDAAFAAVGEVHRLMSFHDGGSDVSRLNRDAADRLVRVHPWTYRVLEAALDLHRRSDGVFDIAIAPALQALNLLPDIVNGGGPASSSPRSDVAIELLPEYQVRFGHRIAIDLGGIAKGFAVDRAIERLQEHGVPQGLVNAGGDLAAFGPETVTLHIRDPRAPLRTLCQTEIANEAFASSGGRFEPLSVPAPLRSAVIDPRTHEPVTTVLGASVRAPSCMSADALTKLVMIAGERALPLLDHYRASAMFLSATGKLHATVDWREVHRAA